MKPSNGGNHDQEDIEPGGHRRGGRGGGAGRDRAAGVARPGVAAAHAYGVSDAVEIYEYAGLVRDSADRYSAAGYDVEMHEYLRRHHIVVTLEQRDTAGAWVVVARAEGADVEGASASTTAHPGGPYRACAAARVDAGATVTACTT
jgi:hypothetical protein